MKRKIKELQKQQKRIVDEIRQNKDNIFQKWEEKWSETQNAGSLQSRQAEEDFKILFTNAYQSIQCKYELNKLKNYRIKTIFLWVYLAEGVLVTVLNLFWGQAYGSDSSAVFVMALKIILGNGCLFSIYFFIPKIIAKWISIARYQETWARYARQRQAVEREIMLYAAEMHPYCDPDRNVVFMTKIMDIWDGNLKIFADNLEKNEENIS